MKKYVQNFWVRFLACILCSVTVVTGVAAGVLIAGVSSVGIKEDVYENGQEIIAENYAAYIYNHLGDTEKFDQEKFTKNLDTFLKDKNFTCSVSKIIQGEEGSESYDTIELYNNLEVWDYVFEIEDGSYVYYDIDAALDALRVSPVIEEQRFTTDVAISGYLFDPETGLFYYQAGIYYFLVDYIIVSYEGTYYDYRIKNDNNGEKIYYNSYYDLILDTSTYEEWDWVQMNDTKLPLAASNETNGNYIRLTTSETVQERVYTGIYYEDTELHSISFYPESQVDTYRILIKVNDLSHVERVSDDMFSEWKNISDAFFENKGSYQAVLVSSVILFILCFALLIYSSNSEKEKIGFWNKVPAACFSFALGLVEVGFGALLVVLIDYGWYGRGVLPFDVAITISALLVFAMAFTAMIWLQNIITRFKTKTFIRYSEFYYAYQIIKWCWSKITLPFKTILTVARENTKLFTRGLVIMFVISFVEFMAIMICWWEMDNYLILFFLAKIVEVPLAIFVLMQMQKLQDGSKRIAAGDLSKPIDTSKMIWEFKKHGENINKVSDGIALAVEDRMKSERFKTELITNVSHDIKTPLTSIINYVDLIKKEDIQDETLLEYVEVLDRQSARLKKLIEDLMEASKASTGNLTVNLEECDVEVLLTQLIGEFEEKLSANQLEVVVQKPEHPVMISADGRHMWRVLDNLLNNACKYSLPGTRVYITLIQEENDVIITFKNISKAALNIPSDELMERFVRGDSSRNTEGSGLGLSIAQSLTELMKGSMKLGIDGDLFKVTLKFQAISK